MIEECKDFSYIKDTLIDDDEMWERCSHDNLKRGAGLIVDMACTWLVYKECGENKALCSIIDGGSAVLEIHIYIIKENRGRNTKKYGMGFLGWVKNNASKNKQKINTKVPVINHDVIRFARSLGFKDEGIDRKSIMKNGSLIDRQRLGITMQEIAEDE